MSMSEQSNANNMDMALKMGYIEMSDINLSIVTEFHTAECEAHKRNEDYLDYIKDGE